MPLVRVALASGRDPALLDTLQRRLAQTVVETLGIAAADVWVILEEVPGERWLEGGVTVAERRARRRSEAHPEAGA